MAHKLDDTSLHKRQCGTWFRAGHLKRTPISPGPGLRHKCDASVKRSYFTTWSFSTSSRQCDFYERVRGLGATEPKKRNKVRVCSILVWNTGSGLRNRSRFLWPLN